jgi:hypothetical protein
LLPLSRLLLPGVARETLRLTGLQQNQGWVRASAPYFEAQAMARELEQGFAVTEARKDRLDVRIVQTAEHGPLAAP